MPDKRPSRASLEAGREVSDARVWVLVGLAGSLAALVGVCMGVLALLDHQPAPATEEVDQARAQVLPWLETRKLLEARRTLSRERLARRAWLDDEHTIAAIPIEDAMRIVAGEPVDPAGREEGSP